MNNTTQRTSDASSILDYLNATYYLDQAEFSNETSSHWRKYGEFQTVKKVNGTYQIEGIGFGDFVTDSGLIRKLKNIPTQLFLKNMLRGCDPNILQHAKRIANHMKRIFSFDVARMALTAQLLNKYIGDLNNKVIVIIGDGYGTLGILLKSLYPQSQIVQINLGRTLMFDVFYSLQCFQGLAHKLLSIADMSLSKDFSYIEAEKVAGINVRGDLFINIASMQEMNPDAIVNYFQIIRSQPTQTFFYCLNRVAKLLPDGTITKFADYDWRNEDKVLLDELCPWHQRAPKNRPPFSYSFDGPIWHRLIQIKPTPLHS